MKHHIIYYIIKIGFRSHGCAKWLLSLISKLILYYIFLEIKE